MSGATTTEFLYDAIYDVLTEGSRRPRALAPAERFIRGYPPGFPNELRAMRAKDAAPKAGSVFVAIDNVRATVGAADEVSDEHLYQVRVVISRDYFVPPGWEIAQLEAKMIQITDAAMRLREVLCWPNNLQFDSHRRATGCNSLQAVAMESRLRVERVGETSDRLLNMQDQYAALFDKQTS